jgi:hypothetical protein
MLLYIEEKVNAMQPWYKRIMNLFATGTDETGTSAPETPPPAQPGMPVKELVEAALNTLPDEISCDECFQEVDRFVELQLAGLDAAQAMPLVQAHLDRCPDCREEYEALLHAMEANEE